MNKKVQVIVPTCVAQSWNPATVNPTITHTKCEQKSYGFTLYGVPIPQVFIYVNCLKMHYQ